MINKYNFTATGLQKALFHTVSQLHPDDRTAVRV